MAYFRNSIVTLPKASLPPNIESLFYYLQSWDSQPLQPTAGRTPWSYYLFWYVLFLISFPSPHRSGVRRDHSISHFTLKKFSTVNIKEFITFNTLQCLSQEIFPLSAVKQIFFFTASSFFFFFLFSPEVIDTVMGLNLLKKPCLCARGLTFITP